MGVQTKHFLNNPASLVVESLQGLCAINPKLGLDTTNKVVFLADQDKSTVALICGGGSGHEPSHAGFVGSGMLTGNDATFGHWHTFIGVSCRMWQRICLSWSHPGTPCNSTR